MDIQILELIDGAKKATGLTVIIDVFRAMTVEAYLLHNGVEQLMPIGSIDAAYKYKKAHPETLLIGERGGKICDGFDFGNSPSAIKNIDFTGKTAVHTTSAGTQGIVNATQATQILLGSFVNAKATAAYIKKKNPANVSLVCMGLEGKESTREDTLCAEYLQSFLQCSKIDLAKGFEECKQTSGAKFFDEAQKSVFPTEDFYLSLETDIFDFAMCIEKDAGGMFRTVKQEVLA